MSAYWPVPWHFIVKVDLGNDIRGVEETRRSQPVRPVGYVAFKIQFSAAEGAPKSRTSHKCRRHTKHPALT